MLHNSSLVAFLNQACTNAHLQHYIDAVINYQHGRQVLTANFHCATINNWMHIAIDFLHLENIDISFVNEIGKFSCLKVHHKTSLSLFLSLLYTIQLFFHRVNNYKTVN